jgi:tRNA (guanine-N7-)-methyltransferase
MHIIKSFVKRSGRKLSENKVDLFQSLLPNYLLDLEDLARLNYEHISLEIGFGKGENIARQAIKSAESLYIGAEVFQAGVASLLSLIKDNNIDNILIWPKDADELLNNIPDNFLANFFLLFPDPWTKRRHTKRRFLQEWRIISILKKLKHNGSLYFASDIKDYVDMVQDLCVRLGLVHYISTEPSFENYQNTRYHEKALREGREVHFIKISNVN